MFRDKNIWEFNLDYILSNVAERPIMQSYPNCRLHLTAVALKHGIAIVRPGKLKFDPKTLLRSDSLHVFNRMQSEVWIFECVCALIYAKE